MVIDVAKAKLQAGLTCCHPPLHFGAKSIVHYVGLQLFRNEWELSLVHSLILSLIISCSYWDVCGSNHSFSHWISVGNNILLHNAPQYITTFVLLLHVHKMAITDDTPLNRFRCLRPLHTGGMTNKQYENVKYSLANISHQNYSYRQWCKFATVAAIVQ